MTNVLEKIPPAATRIPAVHGAHTGAITVRQKNEHGMKAVLYKSVAEVDDQAWNSIVGPDRIICTHAYLAAIEKSHICDCDYFYPVVYENGKIVAHTCIYSMSFELDIFAKGIVKKVIAAIRKVFPSFLVLRFVECGTPVALGNTISFAEGIDKECALKLMIEKMDEAAKIKKIGLLLLRDFTDKDQVFFNNLHTYGFKLVPNLPNSEFDLKWDSFDEYLASLRSRYRLNIRRTMKKLKDNNVTIHIVEDFSHLSDTLVTLWRNCYDNAKEYRREVLTPEFFANIDTHLGSKSKVFLVKQGATILGYSLVLEDDFTLRPIFAGIDYAYNRTYGTYFNIWYSLLDYCMQKKKKYIDMGLTAYEAKIAFGGRVVPLYMYMRHDNFIMNRVLTGLFTLMTPVKKFDKKNTFKTSDSDI